MGRWVFCPICGRPSDGRHNQAVHQVSKGRSWSTQAVGVSPKPRSLLRGSLLAGQADRAVRRYDLFAIGVRNLLRLKRRTSSALLSCCSRGLAIGCSGGSLWPPPSPHPLPPRLRGGLGRGRKGAVHRYGCEFDEFCEFVKSPVTKWPLSALYRARPGRQADRQGIRLSVTRNPLTERG